MCYVYSLASSVLLAVLLGADLVLLVGAARVGAASKIIPLLRRHAPLLSIFLRSFWLSVGPHGRTALELFHPIVSQLTLIEEPRENCTAWIATLPVGVSPKALAQRSLMLCATSRKIAEKHLDAVLAAMHPGNKATTAAELQWREAPKDQQPARPVREGVQFVL